MTFSKKVMAKQMKYRLQHLPWSDLNFGSQRYAAIVMTIKKTELNLTGMEAFDNLDFRTHSNLP